MGAKGPCLAAASPNHSAPMPYTAAPTAAVPVTSTLPGTMPVDVRRVLLATDLSEATELATDWALAVACRNAADLVVLSVIDPGELRHPGGAIVTRVDQVRQRRETAAQDLVERGRRIGVPVTFLVWTGDPGETIVAAAEAEDIDLILVGAHGRGPIAQFLMGSVSEHVARHAPCPVLIVRAPRPTNGRHETTDGPSA